MNGGKAEILRVSVRKEEVVAALLPLQEHWLPLSNLDLLLPPVDVGVFFCYKKPSTLSFGSMVASLKKGLAQALVSYYAFAGEVVPNSAGEPELLCNNRGVLFVEAFADVDLESLNLYNPDDSIEGILVPKKQHGILAVQVTSLKCGGLIVACTFDHRIADAYSANMFLESWAKMAHPTNPASHDPTLHSWQPCFRRSLLSPRRPAPSIHPSFHHMYIPVTKLPCSKPESDSDHLISRIYYITSDRLNDMQSHANSSVINGCNRKRTKLESFCAFLWKTVAAISKDKKVTAKMGIVVNGRKRLSNGNKDKAKLMASYFGNVLSIPFGEKTVAELMEKPLSWVADQVHEFLETAVTEEHFLGLIDWVEAHRPVPGMARIYFHGREDGPAFVVSSGQTFPQDKVDFGWGKPVFASYHFPWGGDAGYVMPMPSPVGNGDWVVYMHLLKQQLEMIESEAGDIFRPLTWDYLNRLM